MGKKIKVNKFNEKKEVWKIKKGEMSEFMDSFKVKRSFDSCLREYTKETFFHRIINIGLRMLWTPYELVYLRLPFSQIFWSIRSLYHRHKTAIFQKKKKKNEERTIKLYRGCELTEKEIRDVANSMNEYIEAEGFLSTTLSEDMASVFAVNVLMEIFVPVVNLKGIGDNGFAAIKAFSEHPREEEVLINAFNVFKILHIKKPYTNE